jgi:hypothetical protein
MNEYQTTSDKQITSSYMIGASGREVIRIQPDGSIFWNQREVVGDEMFRAAMVDLLAVLRGFK